MRRWVDISRYQVERSNPLDLTAARDAGYSIVNIALTGGRGYTSGSWAKSYADAAAVLGMGRSCYHWLDGRTSGRVQALQQLDRMLQVFGSLRGFAHCVDVEETGKDGVTPPTWQHVVDYVGTVQEALNRPVVIYSADWWWQPRNWPGSTLTPYVMGMPNTGPAGSYPGDTSPLWSAGWGGWSEFAVMQWGVAPLPGTGNCSLSVIRDPAVWAAITGGAPMAWEELPASKTLFAEFNTVAPGRDKASDGRIGDGEHSQNVSDHNPDETGNVGSQSDADRANEVHAADVDSSGPWPAGWSMERFVQFILARCRSGAERRLRYIIFNRRIWSASNGWREESYSGANPHDKHAHFSFRYGSGEAPANPEKITTPYGILTAVRASQLPQEDEVSEADVIAALNSNAGQNAIRNAVYGPSGRTALQDAVVRANVNAVAPELPPYSLGGALGDSARRTAAISNDKIPNLVDLLEAVRSAVDEITPGVPSGPATPITPDLLAQGVVLAMKRTFGDQGSAFLAAMRDTRLVGDDTTPGQ